MQQLRPEDEADSGDDDPLIGDRGEGLPSDRFEGGRLGEYGDQKEKGDGPSHLPHDGADGVYGLDEVAHVDLASPEESRREDHQGVAE